MFQIGLLVACTILLGAAITAVLWARWKLARRRSRWAEARKTFRLRREWLEAWFVETASSAGELDGLIWRDCQFDDEVAFVRDRETGDLQALVAVTLRRGVIEAGESGGDGSFDRLNGATVVFRFDGAEWISDGRAHFNLNPAETIRHFHNQLEVVE